MRLAPTGYGLTLGACSLLVAAAGWSCGGGGGTSASGKTATSVVRASATAAGSGSIVGPNTGPGGPTPAPAGRTSTAIAAATAGIANTPTTPGAGGTPSAGTTPGSGTTPGTGTDFTPPAGPTLGPTPTPLVVGGDADIISVDADPSTPDVIDTSVHHAVGSTFTVGVNFVTGAAQQPFAGLELQLAPADLAILTLDTSESGDTALRATAGVPFGCGPARPVATGPDGNTHVTCTADAGTVNASGQAFLVSATCVSKGAAQVHLVRGTAASTGSDDSVEDEVFGVQLYQTATAWIPAALNDAEVICD